MQTKIWASALAVSVIAVGVSTLASVTLRSPVRAASMTADEVGEVVLVDANDPSRTIVRGDQDTVFVATLPQGASCPGDSMHDQWRVQTFVVPATDDIASLDYGVIGPDGANQYALFGADLSARSYANVLTQANAAAGVPGLIAPLAPMSFAVIAKERLPSGTYSIGLACTYFGETARFWQTEIVVQRTSDQLDWRLSAAPALSASSGGDSRGPVIAIVLALLGALALVAVVVVRRNRSTTPLMEKST